jgi:hypothetical protein
MAENLFDQSVEDLNTDQTLENQVSMQTETAEQQQDPFSDNSYLPSNYLSQSSLFTDGKGKPLDSNPKARAAAANHLIQDKLPQPTNFDELVRRNRAILDSDPLLASGALDQQVYRTSVVRRYDDQDYGYIPNIDNDDFYGKREAWYETLGKGAFRLPTYVVTKTLQGAGFLGGLASPWNWGSDEGVVYKAADNWLYKAMESFDDYTKNEWMPTFQEAADREKGFWARAATDGDFWSEDVVDGLAFMVSAWIPGMALSKLGLGAAAMRGLGAVSRVGATSLGTSIEGAEAIANYFTQAQRAAKGIDQFGTWALATASESMFEAKEVRDNVRNSLRQKIKTDGTYYTDDEINKIAGEAARSTFLMNSALLGATNIFQMKYFAKAFGMGKNAPVKGGIAGGAGLATQAALSPTESALKYYGKIIGGGIAREGFIEENVQLAIQRVNERYGTEGKMSSLLDFDTYADLMAQYSAQTVGAVGGVDTEAAMNIGLGGLLGAGSNVVLSTNFFGLGGKSEREKQKLSAEQALEGYNAAQENWLKFGNIYKTEEVKTQDVNGNEVISNRVVLDNDNQPVIDTAKLHAAVTGIQVSSDMITDAQNTNNKHIKNYLRFSAFSEFVQAHINAGLESTLINKLDALKTAAPEDLAKLGFVADETFVSEIEKHKRLASTIISQNKILNDSILFDNSKEDRARKSFLTSLAAKQAVSKFEILDIDNENNEAKNQFLTNDITSLSDGIVDQLNQILYRIESNKEVIEYIQEQGRDKSTPMSVYEKLTAELEKSLEDLIKNNETTVSALKKDEEGFYKYEKEDRNDFVIRQFLDSYLKTKGQLLNDVKSQGLTWAFFADNKDGKNNYTTYVTAEVDFVNEQKKKKAEEEEKLKEQEAEEQKKKDEEEGIVDKTLEGQIEQEEEEEETLTRRDLTEEEEEQAALSMVEEEAPSLQSYLKEKYDTLIENNPEFKLTIDDWIRSGGANWVIKEYNKRYGTTETLFDNKKPIEESEETSNENKQKLIDGLSLANITKATYAKALAAVQKVLDQLNGDNLFIQKLITKVSEIKNEVLRISIVNSITGNQDEKSEYVDLRTVFTEKEDSYNPNDREHGVVGIVNINNEEFQTGFLLKQSNALKSSLASNLSSINERVRVIATRKFVNENLKNVKKANIPNRNHITYENKSDVVKLKKGISIIASSAKSQGFGTQIFTKDSTSTQNAYVSGIENYAIVHPDNTTVPVTFSEEQRQFVKNNMLVDNQRMTDAQFDRLQALYNKVQEYNAEVELLLGENEELDVTPIFNNYFTISKQQGRFAQQGQTFESLVESNPDSLFDIMYQTEDGEVLEKKAILIAEKNKGGWITQFILNPGETLVYMDEAGDVFPVTKISQYLNDVHGINPQFDNTYPGVYTWVAKQLDDAKGYKPYNLKRDTGTSPVKDFKIFANDFRELKEAILEGSSKQAETKELVYKGQTFSTLDDLIKSFNMNVYGFYGANGWYPNFKYNSVTKKFAIELRPANTEERRSLTKDQKKALDLYINDGPILFVTDSTKDDDVVNSYNSFVKNILSSFDSLTEKLSKSDDATLRQYATSLTSRSLVYYETDKNSTAENINYILKIVDKKSGSKVPVNYLRFSTGSNVGGLKLALNEEPVQVKNRNPVKAKKQGLVSLGTLNDSDVPGGQIDKIEKRRQEELDKDKRLSEFRPSFANEINAEFDEQVKAALEGASSTEASAPKKNRRIIKRSNNEDPFMLRSEEQYRKYTENSYNEEVQWLNRVLKNSGIALRDLGTIIDNLSAKKQVLGYYKDRAIYVNNVLSAEGSIYHEAFHGLFRDILTSDQRAFYLSKARGKMGLATKEKIEKFRSDRNYTNKTDREIVDLMAEELLAEGFRKFKLNQKEPADSWFKKFVRLIDRIVSFFNKNRNAIDNLYRDFDGGVYSEQVANPADTISKEGVFALAYGRPRLDLIVDETTGEEGFHITDMIPLNMEVQKELVAKLTYLVANMSEGSFAVKYDKAVQQLRSEYDIEALVQAGNPALADAIRNKYQNKFNEASFVLGVSVRYVLDESIINDEDANNKFTEEGENLETEKLIKDLVRQNIESLGLDPGFSFDDLQIPEDEEDQEESNKGGEFDKIHINPLNGLTREFRSLFNIIPYKYVDPTLGVTLNRTADGHELFNAMIKVASDKSIDQILPSLDKAVKMMEEDGDPKYVQLKAFSDFIQRQFGIADLSDPTSKPTRNLFLYKQFIDTFFVTELSSYVIKNTLGATSKSEIFDASINEDIANKKEGIKLYFEQSYRKLNTVEQRQDFNKKFKELQGYIKGEQGLLVNLENPTFINNRKTLNRLVDELKQLMDDVNIVLPKNLLRQSFLAIYNLESGLSFNANSKQNIADMEADQRLMKENAYLQKDFFIALSTLGEKNFPNIFADTKVEKSKYGTDLTKIDQINSILKKAVKYVIKYDINSAASVYLNAENKNIYRYTRYTPPILLTQIVREKGIDVLQDMYPEIRAWFDDNPLFDKNSLKNQLFLENLEMSSFGGIRQEIGDSNRKGVTFGNIDSKALHLSSVVYFMNREKITSTRKNEAGKKENVEIITFKRSRTQEEGTTTNFLVTGMYNPYTKGGEISARYVLDSMKFLEQEYNRIQREFKNFNDPNIKTRKHTDYNNSLNGRAFKFENFKHFFEEQQTDPTSSEKRLDMRDTLINLAKEGVTFKQALSSEPLSDLGLQLERYAYETFKTLKDDLARYGLIKEVDKKVTSSLLPTTIKQEFKELPLEDLGYSNIEDVLLDFHLNVEMNKRMVNQIYDGDIAVGIKDSKTYFKRNKSGVISGNSMKTGYFRTAVVEELVSYFYTSVNPLTGEYDIDLTRYTTDENEPGTRAEKVADGQSYHTMNHRIRMMDSWGRVDTSIKAILQKAKYKKLDKDDIDTLEERKVVLNTIKTATGGIFEYYKLSEHLVDRPDISRLVVPDGMTVEEVESELDELYTRIETLEDLIVEDPALEDLTEGVDSNISSQIIDLYNEVHKYWEPRRGREKLHYMLNSMELSGVDQLFDPNASKKATLVPVALSPNEITDLKPSKSSTSGMFKFLQVETSGVKDRILLQSQARQLLTTYINKLDNDMVFGNKSLKELSKEYSYTLGEITKSSDIIFGKAFLDSKGNLDVTQLFTTMYNGLKKQGADSNTLKYFAVRKNEETGLLQPVHNPNLPAIKKIFTYYYFSLFNDSIFAQKISGRSDILVSEYGYQVLYDTQDNNRIITQLEQDRNPELYRDTNRFKTRNLGVSVEKVNGKNIYTIEVMIPDFLSKNASERELFLTKLTKFFATRIPTEDKRSMIVAKVVDYLSPSYRNSIVVPQLVHILAGSDLDVDKLYGHTFDYYIDYNEEAHVFGDYSKYATESQGQFAEYIQYMGDHSAFKDLVDAELKTVTAKPIFTTDFIKIAKQLGISTAEMTVDEIKEKREDILQNLDILQKSRKDLQDLHDIAFNAFVSAAREDRDARKDEWREKRVQYLLAKDSLNAMRRDFDDIKVELSKMNKTLKLVALVNVLKNKKMPVTQAELTKYLKSNPTPVIPVMHNTSLQQKMDILSNEKVFQDFYINERSSTKPFSDIAESIGASVDSVVTQNSIFSVMGDSVANQLNSSSKDGIGIAASFNKFLAFSEKNKISLNVPMISMLDSENKKQRITEFTNSDAIRNTGQALGMFADAAKDPIPSVLNLNPDTAGVSNVIMGMTGNLQLALLINKIPFVESITNNYRDTRSAIQGGDAKQAFGLRSLFSNHERKIVDDFKNKSRLGELFEVNNQGEILYGRYKTVYFKTSPIDKIVNEQIEEYAFVVGEGGLLLPQQNVQDVSKSALSNFGISLFYEDGSNVLDDAAQAFIANLYYNGLTLNTEIQKLGSFLNLIKQQKPDFGKLDDIVLNYDYFISGTSIFGDSIVNALLSSNEYGSLIRAARKMSEYSRSILIERDPLFASINTILNIGLNNTYGNERAPQDISDQITKFIVVNKIKTNINEEIEKLKSKEDDNSKKKLFMLEESAKYFTADFWLDNNTFVDDLDYLYTTNPGNPFVEFLKVNDRKGIDFLEATSRMKLDKDVTENIINGYESLQKSADDRTQRLSRQLFYYLLVKDGLGYGAYTFIKYINPDIKQMIDVSASLSEFQQLLINQSSFIENKRDLIADIQKSGKSEKQKEQLIDAAVKDIYDNYQKLFDKYFNNKSRSGQIDWINGMSNKIFSFAGNQKYVKNLYIDTEEASSKNTVTEAINNGVFSHIDKIKQFSGKYFDFITSAPERFTLDFSAYKQEVNQDLAVTFRQFSPQFNDDFTINSVSFNVLLSNGKGKLYKLNKIDGKSISESIARTSIEAGFIANAGLTAEYVTLDVEGTNNLLNFGFNKKDAIKIFNSTKPVEDLEARAREMGYDGSITSKYSDNKTKEQAPSNYENALAPIPGEEMSDDQADALINSGQLVYKGKSTGQQVQKEEEDNSIGFRTVGEEAKTPTAEPVKKQSITVPYTPKGKEMQVYTVIGSQIFNKDNQEVFKEDSVDRNKIFANVAIKTGRAVVVPHKGVDYIVNTKNQVISSVTGKIMQWDENNGNLRAILAEATKKFTPVGADILMREIDDIYNKKSVKDVSLDEYRTQAQDFIKKLSAAGLSKPAILEQLNCL